MRMSSGAVGPVREAPLGRSSCGLLTPRSNRIPTMSLVSPRCRCLSTISAMCSKPPCTMRTRSPKGSSAAPAAATAAGSRSMPRSRRSGRALEERPGVATAADRGVDDQAGRDGGRGARPPPGHHRPVEERRHPLSHDPPPRSPLSSPSGPPPAPRTRRRKRSGRKGPSPRRPGGWWRARRLAVVNALLACCRQLLAG